MFIKSYLAERKLKRQISDCYAVVGSVSGRHSFMPKEDAIAMLDLGIDLNHELAGGLIKVQPKYGVDFIVVPSMSALYTLADSQLKQLGVI